MPKRFVVVHDCGHIVQPGDALTPSRDPERTDGAFGLQLTEMPHDWVFESVADRADRIIDVNNALDRSGVIVVHKPSSPEYANAFSRVFYALRFDCIIS